MQRPDVSQAPGAIRPRGVLWPLVETAAMSALLISYIWGWGSAFNGDFTLCVVLYFSIGLASHLPPDAAPVRPRRHARCRLVPDRPVPARHHHHGDAGRPGIPAFRAGAVGGRGLDMRAGSRVNESARAGTMYLTIDRTSAVIPQK